MSLLFDFSVINYSYYKPIKRECYEMNDKLKNQQMENLLRAVLSLNTMEECYAFFEDLCTVMELKSMAQRFEVARLLSEGHVYGDVVKTTGASTATISRVNRALNYGNDAYRMALDRIRDNVKDGTAGV